MDEAGIIEQALMAYDVGPPQRYDYHAGTAAKTWRVITEKGDFLLRTRGSRTSSDAAIEFDQALRDHLLRQGIPTAAPLHTERGKTFTRVGTLALELYEIVPGRTRQEAGPDDIAQIAEMLARFHLATQEFTSAKTLPPVAQYRTLGIATEALRMESPTLLTVIYGKLEAEADCVPYGNALACVKHWLTRLRAEFADEVYASLPHTVTHGDFTLANILFDGRTISGIFDFDWARWAPRIRDIADGLFFVSGQRETRLVPANIWSLTEAVALSAERARLWLHSYQQISVLSEREIACIPLALAARWLSVRVEGMAKVETHERTRFALGNVIAPLNWLEQHWHEVATD